MAKLNPNQFDIQDVPASQLNAGDRLVGLFGQSWAITDRPHLDIDKGTTTYTSELGTRTVNSKLTHTIVKRPPLKTPESVLHGRLLAEAAVNNVSAPKKRFWKG